MGIYLDRIFKATHFAPNLTLKVDAKKQDAFAAMANKPINPKMVAYTKRITAMAATAAAKPPISPPIKLVVAA